MTLNYKYLSYAKNRKFKSPVLIFFKYSPKRANPIDFKSEDMSFKIFNKVANFVMKTVKMLENKFCFAIIS